MIISLKSKIKNFFCRHQSVSLKNFDELQFWREYMRVNGTDPESEYYQKFMMDMGEIKDKKFFENFICLDIGCGPKGSLTWLKNAKAAIGLDPLANKYMEFGIDKHEMIYLSAPAEKIPLPNHYVDVIFSMNSLDHVDNPITACAEIRRVLKPGGFFIGSLNLDEKPTTTEPNTLTEDFLFIYLFENWEKQFYKVRPRINDPKHFGPYKYFYEECPKVLIEVPGPKALWCRFKVK
jgi:ubiquinone/menaquinone biosynthesis C-methylase UbiE